MANETRHSINSERIIHENNYFKLSLEELEDIARRARRRAIALKLIWMADELAKLSDAVKINVWVREMDNLRDRLDVASGIKTSKNNNFKKESPPDRQTEPSLPAFETSSAAKSAPAYQWSPQSLAKWAFTGFSGQHSDDQLIKKPKKQPDELSICTDKNTKIDVVTPELLKNRKGFGKTASTPIAVKNSPFITNLAPYTPLGVGSVVDAMSENVVTAVEWSTSLITLPLSIVGLGKMPGKRQYDSKFRN